MSETITKKFRLKNGEEIIVNVNMVEHEYDLFFSSVDVVDKDGDKLEEVMNDRLTKSRLAREEYQSKRRKSIKKTGRSLWDILHN